MGRARLIMICLFALVVQLITSAKAEKRIALIIGNGAYKNISQLTNPENDARLIAEVLQSQGFEVSLELNLEYRAMKRAIRAYTAKIKTHGKDTIGLVFYAGHGVQVGETNYLLPVTAEIKQEGDIEIEAISASSLLFGLQEAGNRLNIIVFDACRNNPYRSLFRAATRGLRQMDAPMGSLIAFSTSPGELAADGTGKNSPFTAALASSIRIPGLDIEGVFKATRQKVYEQSGHTQLPWTSSSLLGDFYPAGPGGKRNETAQLPLNSINQPANSSGGGNVTDPVVARPSQTTTEKFQIEFGKAKYLNHGPNRVVFLHANWRGVGTVIFNGMEKEIKFGEAISFPHDNGECDLILDGVHDKDSIAVFTLICRAP